MGEPKGTPLYMAPEVMRKEEITEKVDVYSVGVITWELLTREDPFADHEDYQTFVDAVCNDNERPIIPRWCPASLRKIIQVVSKLTLTTAQPWRKLLSNLMFVLKIAPN